MKNIVKKILFIGLSCLMASTIKAADVKFTMSDIFDGQKLSFDVTSPVAAKVSSNTSKGNAPNGKLGSTNNYFEVILKENTFTAAKINGFINTGTVEGNNWGFQFSTDKGATWGTTYSQPNDGNKTTHEIAVTATIPANANGFRVIRLSGTSTTVESIVMTIDGEGSGGGGEEPGGGDDPGTDPTPSGGGSEVIIRVDLSGNKASTQTMSGTIGGTSAVNNMGSSSPYKLNSNGAYVSLVLASGTFEATDTLVLDGSKKMQVYYGEAGSGTELLTTNAPSNGVIVTALDGLPAGQNSIYIYRVSSTYNGTLTYMEVRRPKSDTPPTPVAVESVSLNKTTLTLEAGQTETLTATVKPDNADNKNIAWKSDNTNVATVDENGKVSALAAGTATITVTTEDQGKTATCVVTVTAPAAPIEVESISIKEATTITIGGSETLSVTYTPADANTGKAITWTSDKEGVAKVDENGKVTGVAVGTAIITATTEKGKKATCTVTVEAVAVTGVTLDKTSATLKVGENLMLTAFVAPTDAANKNVTWESSNTAVATVARGYVTSKAAGTAKITVTTEDGGYTASCTVTVTEASPVPQTDLTLHLPEVYNARESEGGYGANLTVINGREYEVYYMTRDGNSEFCIATTNADKTTGITTRSSDYACTANDGWFKFKGTGWSSSSDALGDEFATMARRLDMDNSCEFSMHLSGFDQFAIVARDKKKDTSSGQTKPDDNRYLEVYIDDVLQPQQFNNSPSIRRYDITSGEHVVRVKHIGSEKSAMYAFSLRVAQEPRVKYLDGNDSSQVIWASKAIKPITYYTKYNKMGKTLLSWDGPEATGISLKKTGEGAIGDTLQLAGTANCPAGEYHYRVESFTSAEIMTASVTGTFTVKTQISFMNLTDTILEVYQGEEMDPILFSYYANSANDITIDWGGNAPAGITGSGENGRYSLGGTPQTIGTFNYTISVAGGNSVKGQLIVLELNLGDNPVLYLQSDRDAYKQDGIYAYLTSRGYNLVARVAQSGLRKEEQYAMYKWILISEDADADNGEVLAVTREGANRPVLNMKSFSYAPERLDWGEPNKGSVSDEGRFITVTRADHPIFQSLHKKQGDKIMVLDTVIRRGLMPIDVHLNGTLCLATALKGDIEDYYADGEPATFLHEIPATMRGGYKYICMPIGMSSSQRLTTDGKKLLEEVIKYLQSSEQTTILPPTLQITDFRIGDLVGDIDEATNTITININRAEYPDIDLSAIVPTITLADPDNTFLVPDANEPVDLEWTQWIPVYYTVTDYVSQRTYTIIVNIYSPEGIENVYSTGEWVNIFDIYGRKIATTNEDIYSMPLPHGMYIVVTENGQTLKIMR